MKLLTWMMRLVGRVLFAVSDEIDRACSTYTVEVPAVLPDWLDQDTTGRRPPA